MELEGYAYHIIDSANPAITYKSARPAIFHNQWGGSSKVFLIKETGDLQRIRDAALHLWRNRKTVQLSDAWINSMNDPNGAQISLVMAGIHQQGV